MSRLSGGERQRLRIYRADAYRKQNGKCHWCGGHVEKDEATADHLSEVRCGGATSRENIVMACRPCNNDRSNRNYHHDHVRVWLRVKLQKSGIWVP